MTLQKRSLYVNLYLKKYRLVLFLQQVCANLGLFPLSIIQYELEWTEYTLKT